MVSLSNLFTLIGIHSGVFTLNVVIYQCGYKVLAIFIDANTWIKGVQIWDHEMKILNFPNYTTIFLLKEINCQTRTQSIKKSHEMASNSKTNFLKIQALWAGAYENRIDKPGQMIWSNNNWVIINDK